MDAYPPAMVWILGAAVCFWIARVRHVRPNFFWNALVALLGPFAIPLIFLAKPDASLNPK